MNATEAAATAKLFQNAKTAAMLLRQLGGMVPGTKVIVDQAVELLDEGAAAYDEAVPF